jgi:hypothetical protein
MTEGIMSEATRKLRTALRQRHEHWSRADDTAEGAEQVLVLLFRVLNWNPIEATSHTSLFHKYYLI